MIRLLVLAFLLWPVSAQASPWYCKLLMSMERSCYSAQVIASKWGPRLAERMARACGATDADIADAKRCLK